jgi:hypothetical protein
MPLQLEQEIVGNDLWSIPGMDHVHGLVNVLRAWQELSLQAIVLQVVHCLKHQGCEEGYQKIET